MAQSQKVSKEYGLVSNSEGLITADGGLSPYGSTSMDSSGGALALTMSVGPAGTIKILNQVGTGTNNCVVTSLYRTGASTDTTTATFNAADESLILVSIGTRWQVVLNTNAVTLA